MFGKRKSSDGFEWHRYVRTAVRVRREARKEKVREAGRAAGEHVGAAGMALVAGSKAAGHAAYEGTRAGLGGLWLLAIAAWNILVIIALHAADKTGLVLIALWYGAGRLLRPLLALLARPKVGVAMALASALLLGAALSRFASRGLDGQALWMLAAAFACAIATLPLVGAITGMRAPRLPSVAIAPRALGAVALVLVLAVGVLAGTRHLSHGVGIGSLVARLPALGGAEPVTGRAVALAGDRVRLAGQVIRLSGIELPEAGQLCGKAGSRQVRCAGAVAATLSRVIGNAPVSCTLEGQDSAGVALGRCLSGEREINGELVRLGFAFAERGLISSRYGSQEDQAKAARLGIWSAGESMRPAEWRDKLWEEAKKKAPEGCPIKGTVSGGAKIYLLPWSPDYARGRVQAGRGERWFCSESEAEAAGWKPRQG